MVLGLDMRFLGRKRGKINHGEAMAIESVVSACLPARLSKTKVGIPILTARAWIGLSALGFSWHPYPGRCPGLV